MRACVLVTPQTGIGRTGKVWGYENFDVEPDVVASAKVSRLIVEVMPLLRFMYDTCVFFFRSRHWPALLAPCDAFA